MCLFLGVRRVVSWGLSQVYGVWVLVCPGVEGSRRTCGRIGCCAGRHCGWRALADALRSSMAYLVRFVGSFRER